MSFPQLLATLKRNNNNKKIRRNIKRKGPLARLLGGAPLHVMAIKIHEVHAIRNSSVSVYFI